MSFIDLFSWIVLLIVVATIVVVFVALGMMPGHVARKRGHPWAEAVTVGSWATLIRGFVFGNGPAVAHCERPFREAQKIATIRLKLPAENPGRLP